MADDTARSTSQASVSESNRSRIVKHLYHNGIIASSFHNINLLIN